MQEGAPPPDEKEAPRVSSSPPRPSQAPRPSQPPLPYKGIGRVFFAVAWLGVQVALVLTADRRIDAAFGFRMFVESSSIRMSLYRDVTGADGTRTRVHVDDGVWSANDAGGLRRRFAWSDRVRRYELAIFDRETSAKYGAAATLARLQAALDDVSTHTADDAETRRFLLYVTVRRNGREPYVVHLTSAERAPGGS
ncbi:hypothetical protein BH11MYX4_BH11MYX4_51290 [soil metagenome]